ncbi:MAG: LysR family transcriptional regulator [Pseudomonadota bacterium]
MNTNLAGIDLNLIVALHALLGTRSVSRAAEQIHRTQPATSHALARLRSHFGDPLLVRNGRSMELTDLATALQVPVEHAVRHLDAVLNTRQDFDPATSTRTVRIATRDIGVPLFADFIARVHADAPGICVEFIQATDFPAAVARAEADVALGFGREVTDTALQYRAIPPLAFSVFAPATHPFANSPTLARWRAAHHIGVGGSGRSRGPVEHAASARGIERRFVAVAPTFLGALALANTSHALLTTLEKPLMPYAQALGMVSHRCPLVVPAAQAYLLSRTDFGNPFERWLANTLTASFGDA